MQVAVDAELGPRPLTLMPPSTPRHRHRMPVPHTPSHTSLLCAFASLSRSAFYALLTNRPPQAPAVVFFFRVRLPRVLMHNLDGYAERQGAARSGRNVTAIAEDNGHRPGSGGSPKYADPLLAVPERTRTCQAPHATHRTQTCTRIVIMFHNLQLLLRPVSCTQGTPRQHACPLALQLLFQIG